MTILLTVLVIVGRLLKVQSSFAASFNHPTGVQFGTFDPITNSNSTVHSNENAAGLYKYERFYVTYP
jgi:hypothetical protein